MLFTTALLKRGSSWGGSFIHKLAIDQVRGIWCRTIPQVGKGLIMLIGKGFKGITGYYMSDS